MIVGFVVFAAKPQTPQTPLQSCGKRMHAFLSWASSTQNSFHLRCALLVQSHKTHAPACVSCLFANGVCSGVNPIKGLQPNERRGLAHHTRVCSGVNPSMGITCGSVREPGSLTLPFSVGCLRFSTKSKNANTPPEWVGTPLRAFFALRKQSLPQVTPIAVAHHSSLITRHWYEGLHPRKKRVLFWFFAA